MTNINCIGQEKLGKAEIVELRNYEKEDNYFPHDCSMESDMLDKANELDKNRNTLTVKNIANDGFTGHSIVLKLNSKLEVKKAEYDEWTDVLDGSTTNYKIDRVELKLNSDPFNSKNFIGYYTLYMTGYYKAGDILEKEGVKDEQFDREFKGKFNTTCEK
ncbi:hypothetical protein M8845_18635 [Gelidibacter japonicus]|jgi:hypothetical protein|uniref:hypothetical protein n=1 Tax=Gelidibacter japonicus TaxID=1962232 RepID=UPI00202227CC|nr:hypothetical protein [Gelidibacter japonicus]MCL8009444.1 hypothetical protein [Gelidibacter japonicus]